MGAGRIGGLVLGASALAHAVVLAALPRPHADGAPAPQPIDEIIGVATSSDPPAADVAEALPAVSRLPSRAVIGAAHARVTAPSPAKVGPSQATSAPAAITAPGAPLPRFSIVLGTTGGGSGSVSAARAGEAPRAAASAVEAPGAAATEDERTVSVPAYLVSSGKPEYPDDARAEGREADVELEIVVDAGGHVVAATLVRGAGHGFDESALRAIRAYRFSPARHEGAPVRVRMRWTVAFRLQ